MKTAQAVILFALALPVSFAHAEPAAGETPIAILHAQGGQIYECKADAAGALLWHFREPIATLMRDGKTVGRHYAGPTWELADGSAVVASVASRAPGAARTDIPLLTLTVISRHGAGAISEATAIQRLATRGGVAEGPCEAAGLLLSVPYSADYVFYRRVAPALH